MEVTHEPDIGHRIVGLIHRHSGPPADNAHGPVGADSGVLDGKRSQKWEKNEMIEKQYIASLSYGKDSIAMLHVIRDVLGMSLDRIITADVWATDTIPAELPPMVNFKEKADRIIKERWGIEVEHLYATRSFQAPLNVGGYKCTYENIFYTEIKDKNGRWANNRARTAGRKCHNPAGKRWIYGFPCQRGAWCNSKLKVSVLSKAAKGNIPKRVLPDTQTHTEKLCGEDRGVPVHNCGMVQQRTQASTNNVFYSKCGSEVVQYIGIAADEGARTERHRKKMEEGKEYLPLVEAGWTEQMCRDWCEENDLLSPMYTSANRGGCWFCHNQGVDQLRILRREYPEYWSLLLKWDADSPVTFHPDGRTVHDFDRRFRWEDEGYKPSGKMFRWSDIDSAQMNIYQLFDKDDYGGED